MRALLLVTALCACLGASAEAGAPLALASLHAPRRVLLARMDDLDARVEASAHTRERRGAAGRRGRWMVTATERSPSLQDDFKQLEEAETKVEQAIDAAEAAGDLSEADAQEEARPRAGNARAPCPRAGAHPPTSAPPRCWRTLR